MDLNYFLKREQVELMLADTAACLSSRASHRAMARAYGVLIAAEPYPHRSGEAD